MIRYGAFLLKLVLSNLECSRHLELTEQLNLYGYMHCLKHHSNSLTGLDTLLIVLSTQPKLSQHIDTKEGRGNNLMFFGYVLEYTFVEG